MQAVVINYRLVFSLGRYLQKSRRVVKSKDWNGLFKVSWIVGGTVWLSVLMR